MISPETSAPTKFLYGLGTFAFLLLAGGLYFDGWWHATFGRHSFWIPPHLIVYAGVALLVATVGLRWFADRRAGRPFPAGFRLLAWTIAVTILAAPLDELWHRAFGEEPTFSLGALWSPPHLMALLSGVVGGLGLTHTMARENGARELPWTMAITLACVTAYASFAAIPFEPTSIYRVAGIAGAYLITFLLVGLRLFALALIRRPGVVTVMAAVITPLVLLLTLPALPPSLSTMARLPWWVLAAAAFGAAATLDGLAAWTPQGLDDPRVFARWGAVFSLVFSLIFYPAANATIGSGLSALEVLAIVAGSVVVAYGTGHVAWQVARRLGSGAAGPTVAVPAGAAR